MTQPSTPSRRQHPPTKAATKARPAPKEPVKPPAEHHYGGVPVLLPTMRRIPVPSVHVGHVQPPHVPHVHVPTPHVELPDAVRHSIEGRRGMFLWWGGLVGAAAVGVLEWPVAAAVGIGTYVAQRAAGGKDEPAAATEATGAAEKAKADGESARHA